MKGPILVTGGAGFIGSHLCRALVAQGKEVISLDRRLVRNEVPGVTYYVGSTMTFRDRKFWGGAWETLNDVPPSIIYHLGEYARVESSFDDIETVWRRNALGTFELLQYWREKKCKLVYAGSSTKFATVCDGPEPTTGYGRHLSPYAFTKAMNVDLIENFTNWFDIDLNYAIAYFSNVYGPGEQNTLIEIFRQAHERGEPLPVVSPGTQRRAFTHVDDIVRGLLLVGESGYGDGYVLGSKEEYSVLEVARMFGGEVNMLPPRAGNRYASVIDTSRSEEELGWRAEKKLTDYVSKLLRTKEA